MSPGARGPCPRRRALPRRDHQATLLADGTVLVTGKDGPGIRFERGFVPYAWWRTERFHVATGSWTVGENCLSDAGYATATLCDPLARTWTPAGGMTTGRYFCAATPLPDGSVLATGGTVRSGRASPSAGEDLLTATTEVFWI